MRRLVRQAGEQRLAWALLAVAMCASATWLLIAGNGLSFTNDDVFYYMQYVVHGWDVERSSGGLEYLLAPSNGHLQVGGKLVYRAVFETFGANYFVLRAIDVAGVMLCVGLFFALARKRVGPLVALVPCVSLLTLGFGWEALLWAFDMHTIYSLAFGLGALLALERGDRRGDLYACALLILSLAMIELGLAFAAGAAIAVLLAPRPAKRAWIFLVPLALYGCWWLWAQDFDQEAVELGNLSLVPITWADSLAAVLGSVFGLNPTGDGVPHPIVQPPAWASALAALAALGLAWRIALGRVPRTLWVFLGVVLAYWVLVAVGARPPDSSRYIFVGTLLTFLVAADALARRRIPARAALAALALVALAIPANAAKLDDGRDAHRADATTSRTEYAMLDLARGRVRPDYVAVEDPRVLAAGGTVFTSRPAGDYLAAADEFGALGFSLDRIRGETLELRQVADATLVGALAVRLRPADAPAEPGECPSSRDGTPASPVFFALPRGGALLGSISGRPVEVAVGRFGTGGPGQSLGRLEPGEWAELEIPPDRANDPWWAVVNGPVYVCDVGVSRR
jgi:hypothetical protein